MTMWMLTAASLVGVVLNIKKNKACFAIWAVTNAAWAVIDYTADRAGSSDLDSAVF